MKTRPVSTPPRAGDDWYWGLVLFALVFLAYLPALHGTFVWDDEVMVTNNALLRSAHGLRDIWFSTKATDPLPITFTALWLQWHAWGANPIGYHIVDVVAHALGALLLWRVLLHFTSHRRLAWLAAAVFGLHPVCAASAAWVSEQKNTLSVLFYFASILFYLRGLDGARRFYWLALAAFAGALMSKDSTVMLPVVLGLIVWWRAGRIEAKEAWRLAPFFVLSLVAGLATIWFQNHKAIGERTVENLHGADRLTAAAGAVCYYAWKALVPLHLSAIYPFNGANWLSVLGLAAVFGVAWYYRKGWGRHVLLGLGCFVATLIPVMGFVDMFFLNYSRVSDHWQYLALPPLLALAVCGLGPWVARMLKKGAPIAAILLLAFLFLATTKRARVYASEEALWDDTVSKNPAAWMAWNNLADAYVAQGKIDEAIDDYNKALALHPVFPEAESNLGNQLVAKHRAAEALEHLRKAVEEEPHFARFHFNYGAGAAAAGQYDLAESQYKEALKLQPHRVDALNNLSIVAYRQHDYPTALTDAQEAIQCQTNLPEPYLNAAKALDGMNHTDDAAHYYEDYLRMRPQDAGAHFEYGTMLAMHNRLAAALPEFQAVVRLRPNEAVGHCDLGNTLAGLNRLTEATAEFREALQLDPDDAQNQNNLGNALAQQGQFTEAIEHYAAAVRLKPDDADARVNYAYALLHSGHKNEAIAEYRRALVLRPGDETIQARLDAALH